MIITIIASFIITTFLGYLIHWVFHQKWSGHFHKVHMNHHLNLYPPGDLFSDEYREPGKDNTAKLFIIAAIPLILLLLLICFIGIISVTTLVTTILTIIVTGYLNDYLHDSFHINNHLLTKIPGLSFIFNKLVLLHCKHHEDMNYNYGIFWFFWDRIFKTYKNV